METFKYMGQKCAAGSFKGLGQTVQVKVGTTWFRNFVTAEPALADSSMEADPVRTGTEIDMRCGEEGIMPIGEFNL